MSNYDIGKIYQDMEIYLIESMKNNLSRHLKEESEYGFDWPQWQAEKLKELKRYQRENSSIVGTTHNQITKEVSKQLKEQFIEGSKYSQKQFKSAIKKGYKPNKKVSNSFFKIDDRKANGLINSVNSDLKTANTAALRMINDQYREIIYKASTFAVNGVMTEKQAIDMATKDFLTRGINCIEYSNGARVNIASYSKMAVRTANQRAQLMGEGEFRKKIGNSLVKISKHGTACKLCQVWEGQILIDDVYSGGTSKDGNYPLLSEAMNQGLYHPNCEHGLGTYYSELDDIQFNEHGPNEETMKQYQNDINYCNLQIQKYRRLEIGSLDKENIRQYHDKKQQWIQKEKNLEERIRPKEYKKLSEQEIDNLQNSSNISYSEFTKLEREAIDEYTLGGYQDVNDYLNGKYEGFDNINDFIQKIDTAISKYDLKEDIITYRGVNKKYYSDLKIGDEIISKMYESTSLNENIAKTFMDDKDNPLMLEIRVPKKTSCIYIGDNSSYEFEAELLLGRNLRLKVIDINDKKIILEVIK